MIFPICNLNDFQKELISINITNKSAIEIDNFKDIKNNKYLNFLTFYY